MLVNRTCQLAALSFFLLPFSASALVGGAGVAANTADSPWLGVGSLQVGGGLFTGTLIAPGYVLTAAHLVQGAASGDVSFQVNGATSYSIAATDIFINPNYTASTAGNASGDPTNHNDIAIIKLANAVGADVPFYNLYGGTLQGADLHFVSFAGSSSVKLTGENIADVVYNSATDSNQNYLFDFDGPTLATNHTGGGTLGANREASLVVGDSGSSAFVNVQGQWQLAGINTFEASFANGSATSGAFGTGGGGVAVSGYAAWISSVVTAPVPEPQSEALFVMGLLGVAGAARRFKKARSTA
jgi:hypothetical protein